MDESFGKMKKTCKIYNQYKKSSTPDDNFVTFYKLLFQTYQETQSIKTSLFYALFLRIL